MSPQRTSPKKPEPQPDPPKPQATPAVDDAKKAKDAEKLARLHRVEDAAKDLKAVWLGSAFYDRQDANLAEALIDALDS